MSFIVQWLDPGPHARDFPTERKAERFKADKLAAGVKQVVVYEVGDEVTECPIERVLSRCIVRPDGCVTWTGATSHGYGQMSVGGKLRRVHIVAWEAALGPVPEGLELDHLCSVRNCVNVEHLEAVTHEENLARAKTALPTMNRAKTECLHGHPFDAPNTYWTTGGGRVCRTCKRARRRAARARRRAAAVLT